MKYELCVQSICWQVGGKGELSPLEAFAGWFALGVNMQLLTGQSRRPPITGKELRDSFCPTIVGTLAESLP